MAASNKIRVNTNSLKSTKSNLENRMKKIEQDILAIEVNMIAMNLMWTGDAHNAFDAQVKADLATLKDVCKNAKNIIKFEDKAHTEYTKCESKVADLVSKIKI